MMGGITKCALMMNMILERPSITMNPYICVSVNTIIII